jgi:hypothetical protein
MPLQDAAEAGFEKAREIYTGKDASKAPIASMPIRYKSSNKLHLASGSTHLSDEFIDWGPGETDQDTAYVARFKAANALHDKERIATKVEGGKVFDIGRTLRISRTPALNCGELACIAAEWAYRQLGNPNPVPIVLTPLAKPADHVFCVVAEPSSLAKLPGVRIDKLENTYSLSDDAWAVDPWLNICCHLRNYGIRAEAQLKKWQSKNKRIAWSGGPLGAGWYAPEGAFSKGFMEAKLTVDAVS